jgi:hypothetical protein
LEFFVRAVAPKLRSCPAIVPFHCHVTKI